jgi:drug/metabolite transporter (DMT)-like permease
VLIALAGGAVSCLGNIAFYAALARAPASVVVPLTAMSPAVAVVLAAVLLRERIGPLQWAGTALSLVAIGLFNRTEGDDGDRAWLLLALVPLVLWGVTLLLQKLATRTLPGGVAAWWFLAAFVPVGVAILLAEPTKSVLSLRTWAVVAALGFTLGLGNVTIMRALSSGGRASVVAPLSGLYPLVSVPLAVGLLGEKLDSVQLLGVVVALVAVWLLSQETGAADAPLTNPTTNPFSPGTIRDEALP